MTNEATPLVAEYSMRRMLARLGYRTDISKISGWKADCFGIISAEISKIEAAEMKRKRK